MYSPVVVYKGYHITSRVLCWDIRYTITGGDNYFTFGNYFSDISSAKKAIDTHIAQKFINGLLDTISIKIDVNKGIIMEILRNMINET